jgi:serine/threonine protein kinase
MFRSLVPFTKISAFDTGGAGVFSTVNFVENFLIGTQMAIKVASPPSGVRNTNEVKIIHEFDFAFIRRMFDSAEADSATPLAMESAAGGTFLNFISRNRKLPDRSIRYLAGELTAALYSLDFTKSFWRARADEIQNEWSAVNRTASFYSWIFIF